MVHRLMSDYYTLTPTQIVMYTSEYCSDCMRVKRFFEAHDIQHLRVGLEGDDGATEFVIHLNNGYQSVPAIIFQMARFSWSPAGWNSKRSSYIYESDS
jgi:glutaredoxin